MSTGSAWEILNIFDQAMKSKEVKNASCAIIGSGIIGLTTALEFKKRYPNEKLKIYAKAIPEFGEKDNSKMITSQIAPGYWLPYSYGSNDPELHQKLAQKSYDIFKEIC